MAATSARMRVPVASACRVLGLSPQGYDTWLEDRVSPRDCDDAHVIDVVLGIHANDPTLGYRFVADELADVGIIASENRVSRLCSTVGVFASHHHRRGTSGTPGPAVHDDLLASVDEKVRVTHDVVGAATGVNQVWLTDISEHPTWEGKRYLCAVTDCYSNKIVGYSIDSPMASGRAAAALGNAIAPRSPETTFVHSDRGSEFRSTKVVRLLNNNGLRASMGASGRAATTQPWRASSRRCSATSSTPAAGTAAKSCASR